MKTTLIAIAVSLMMTVSTQFNIGYDRGYKAGYCYQQPTCIEPISPIAPIPNMNESADSYTDGYNRGFVNGRNAQNR